MHTIESPHRSPHRSPQASPPPSQSTSTGTNPRQHFKMGLFYHRCKDRYIRRCKDWIEHPRPWMHREFNIPPSCNCGPAPTEHTSVLIPILILLLLGLATAYVYKVRKHSSPKMLTLYIPPHKIPYELSISNVSCVFSRSSPLQYILLNILLTPGIAAGCQNHEDVDGRRTFTFTSTLRLSSALGPL